MLKVVLILNFILIFNFIFFDCNSPKSAPPPLPLKGGIAPTSLSLK